MRHLHFGKLFFVVFSLLLAYTVSARKPIKTLLITGQNNHNWQVSHVVLKQILENSGRYDVGTDDQLDLWLSSIRQCL